jgi:hypothetical protein
MSEQPGVEVVIDELVLDGVATDTVPLVRRAIEGALAGRTEIGAGEVADLLSGAIARALAAGGDR